MAAHADLAPRAEAIGASEVYVSEPSKLVADLVARLAAGDWPIVLNVKGCTPDRVPVLLTLSAYEHLTRTGGNGR